MVLIIGIFMYAAVRNKQFKLQVRNIGKIYYILEINLYDFFSAEIQYLCCYTMITIYRKSTSELF